MTFGNVYEIEFEQTFGVLIVRMAAPSISEAISKAQVESVNPIRSAKLVLRDVRW